MDQVKKLPREASVLATCQMGAGYNESLYVAIVGVIVHKLKMND